MYISIPNFVKIGQAVAEILQFFRFLRWPPSAILDFQKCVILTAYRVEGANMYQHAKFRRNRSSGC